MARLNKDRIEHLVAGTQLSSTHVVQAGLGSGGMPVTQFLTQAGVASWTLFDPDVLDEANLVKHPGRRADLGLPKVQIARDWIVDRNPDAQVTVQQVDIRMNHAYEQAVAAANLVLCCVDTVGTRQYISDVCVRFGKPFVLGSVFRRGVGGEVYAYIPGRTGCYRCLEIVAEQMGVNVEADLTALGPSETEEQRIYGLGQEEYKESGLSIDIGLISAYHARLAMAALIGWASDRALWPDANWVILSHRPWPIQGGGYGQFRKLLVRTQEQCNCARRSSHEG
jgi:molybdopterin/thiamine biosynthesis adenylyltransferase